MSRIRPPLTTSMTVPVTTPSSSLSFSIVPQARSYCARFLDRIRRPSLSSFWRTRASTSSPTLDDLVGVDVVLDRQLARGDDALGLVADVEQDLVPVDLDDRAFDDVAVVEVLDRRVDRREEVFSRSDVVDRDLRGGGTSRGFGGASGQGVGSGHGVIRRAQLSLQTASDGPDSSTERGPGSTAGPGIPSGRSSGPARYETHRPSRGASLRHAITTRSTSRATAATGRRTMTLCRVTPVGSRRADWVRAGTGERRRLRRCGPAGVGAGEPRLVGRRGRRLPGRARRLPRRGRRRRLRLVPGGAAGGRRAPARSAGDLAGRRILEVGAGAAQCARWLATPGAGRSRSTCPPGSCGTRREQAAAAGVGGAAGAGRRERAAVRRRERSTWPARPSARCRSWPTRAGADARGGPRAAAGRPLGVLGEPPDALVLPRRPGAGGAGRAHARTSTAAPYVEVDDERPRRSTSSTTARSATGSASWSPPASRCSTSSSRSGRRGTTASGASGARCAARLFPGTAIFVSRLRPELTGPELMPASCSRRRCCGAGSPRRGPVSRWPSAMAGRSTSR